MLLLKFPLSLRFCVRSLTRVPLTIQVPKLFLHKLESLSFSFVSHIIIILTRSYFALPFYPIMERKSSCQMNSRALERKPLPNMPED